MLPCTLFILAVTSLTFPFSNPLTMHLPSEKEDSRYLESRGCQLFLYDYCPGEDYRSTIYILSGITGINHEKETGLIHLLSNGQNRVVVVHPRGTGYSGGTRGDIEDISDFIGDYVGIIRHDKDYLSGQHPIVLFGHSMAAAVALAVAAKLEKPGGVILVNPPYMRKKAKGMSPGLGQYLKYALYYAFARHAPVVDMAGDPGKMENEADRAEAEAKRNDPMLVSRFSMNYMMQSAKLMKSMGNYSRTAAYPLLLIYGDKDTIVDKRGCDILFSQWRSADKQYITAAGGSHGESTVIICRKTICDWISQIRIPAG